jgi:hypothetical protein
MTVWNGTLQQHDWAQARDDLRRGVHVQIRGLPPGRYAVRHRRVGPEHSHLAHTAQQIGVTDWPDERQWQALRERDVLDDVPAEPVDVGAGGQAFVDLDLPTSTLALVELVPEAT